MMRRLSHLWVYRACVSSKLVHNIEKHPAGITWLGCYLDLAPYISLTEAVNNAIIHGNKNDETKKVQIYAHRKENGVAFCVTDEGAGFNHNRVPDPTCAEKLECCGGRGVYIMKTLADKIVFADNGSTVEMYFSIKRHSA
jgi:serine/threonine-protein kinase RsbW